MTPKTAVLAVLPWVLKQAISEITDFPLKPEKAVSIAPPQLPFARAFLFPYGGGTVGIPLSHAVLHHAVLGRGHAMTQGGREGMMAQGFRTLAKNRSFHLRNSRERGQNRQDGGFRNHAARMPLGSAPTGLYYLPYSVSEIRF